MAMSAKASDDIAWLPATAQLAVLAAKKVSSAELVELYLSRIDTYNASLNAIVTVDPDAARRVAKRSDAARARGDELGPLHGLPITVKDSYETAGMRTTCGRRDLADYVPTQDAEAVARLRRAGAIIMGKTNMPTGNQDVQASNPVFGRTNNPWDAARTSGGSAGGRAAATAAGLTSFDYGSEIGGSTRIPAHYCGLYGHKSTWRSVPLVGHIPSAPGNPGRWGQADMACAGVQVRGARDIIPALEATVGPMRADGGFSYALAPPRAGALKDFRVAVWAEDPHCPIDADVRRAMDDAVAALRAAGAHVVEQPATIPVDMAVSHNIFQSLVFGAFAVDRSTSAQPPPPRSDYARFGILGAKPPTPWVRRYRATVRGCSPMRRATKCATGGPDSSTSSTCCSCPSRPPPRRSTTTRTTTGWAAPSTSTASHDRTGTNSNGTRWPTSPAPRPPPCPSPPQLPDSRSASRRWGPRAETAPP